MKRQARNQGDKGLSIGSFGWRFRVLEHFSSKTDQATSTEGTNHELQIIHREEAGPGFSKDTWPTNHTEGAGGGLATSSGGTNSKKGSYLQLLKTQVPNKT